jgi:hypothetical protein
VVRFNRHRSVEHGRLDIRMAEALLHGADALTALQQMRGKAMTQGAQVRVRHSRVKWRKHMVESAKRAIALF